MSVPFCLTYSTHMYTKRRRKRERNIHFVWSIYSLGRGQIPSAQSPKGRLVFSLLASREEAINREETWWLERGRDSSPAPVPPSPGHRYSSTWTSEVTQVTDISMDPGHQATSPLMAFSGCTGSTQPQVDTHDTHICMGSRGSRAGGQPQSVRQQPGLHTSTWICQETVSVQYDQRKCF